MELPIFLGIMKIYPDKVRSLINFLELRDASTHLAVDPGSDVVETAAPRKLLTNIEEGKHL